MLQFAPGVKGYLACKPVDMRRGFDGLADHPNTKIDELLPWKWSGAGSQAIAA